ncbi:protein LTO1 homolog isoform X2 [Aplysia californica]|uniref:Protein LTO1 homolog isoform X2 n=1 Tax=Aplysia californica TaxID=6500 RepID=A0ABM1VW72_APLCA|nr:protein LTO1 homolog isoform X2 [Aplysia californica]
MLDLVEALFRSWQQGYADGFKEGRKREFEEGHHLGVQKGLEIGREIGFYVGFASQVLKKTDTGKMKVIKVSKAIISLASKFPEIDPTDEALTDTLGKIQGKFKQLTSLLGVQTQYTSGSVKGTSF